MGYRTSFIGNGVTQGGWTPAGTSPPAAWLCISKSIENPDDTTYVEQAASTNNTAFFKLSPPPVDFTGAVLITIQIRARLSATKNAPVFAVSIYQNDEVTPLTASTGIGGLTTSFVTFTVNSIVPSGTNTKAVWDTAKLAIGTGSGTGPTLDVSAARVTYTQYSVLGVTSPTSAKLPGTGANVTGTGTVAWVNPSNITLNDGTFSTFSSAIDQVQSNYLQGTNFGFTLPANAIVQGVVGSINRKGSASSGTNSVNDVTVSLIKGGVVSGTNKAGASVWPTTLTAASYGTGTTDLWGLALTATDVNASNFGLALQANISEKSGTIVGSVDSFTLQLYYTVNDTVYFQKGYAETLIGRPSYINSIQYFTITIATGVTSGTATISSVVANNAQIVWGGLNHGDSGATWDGFGIAVTLTNSTTVTATRNTAETNTVTVQGCVVEYVSLTLNSAIQYGSITLGSSVTSNTATISSVTTANAFVAYLGFNSTDSSTNGAVNFANLTLTNSTTVTATRTTGTNSVTVFFVVVEYAPGIVKSMQPRSVTISGTSGSTNDTITAVSLNNAFTVYGGTLTNSTSSIDSMTDIQLTASTTVALTRGYSTSISRTINYTVVEFFDGVLKSIQRQKTSMTTGTSGTSTVSSVNTTKAVVYWNGQNINSSTATLRSALVSDSLTNATTITGTRGFSATGAPTSVASDLLEFY